ncbi:MAG: peptide deformylase [Pseudomonadota bacterium]
MARLTILEYPDSRLHTIAQPVEDFGPWLEQLVEDMIETMYDAKGIGLAATQVNIHRRVLIMDLAKNDEPQNLQVFVNPKIIAKAGEQDYEEGCLSVPGIYETVRRAAQVTVEAQNVFGETFTVEAHGIMAVCLQHEMDHLDGKVFVQYLSRLKQDRVESKLKKRHRELSKKR